MFGLSTLQLGAMAALAAALVGATWFAAHQTEALGKERADKAWVIGEVESQRVQTITALDEIARRDALLADVEAERDTLAWRKQKAEAAFREVLNDPDIAMCGNAAVPGAVLDVVRRYAAPAQDYRRSSGNAAAEPHHAGP